MADNLKPPAGAAPPFAAGSKVQPKKETVRISLPLKPTAKETVRLELPPRTAAAPAPAAPRPAGAAPTAPAPSVAKQTVRLSLPPKPSAAKETVRLELPPKPGAGVAKAGAAAGGKEIKLLVPQVDHSAASASIPESSEAEMPTMDSSQAQPAPAAAKPAGGLKGGPPGSRPPPGGLLPGKVAQAPASALPDSTPSAMALPAKKALPKLEMSSAPMAAGGVVVRGAGWPDYTLAIMALVAGIGAVVHLLMILGAF